MSIDRCRRWSDRISVDSQENVDHCKRDSLVSVHERMVLHEALAQGRSLVDERFVVAGLWAVQSRFERADIANPPRAAIALDQVLVKEESIRGGEVFPHLASLRYSSSRSSRLFWKASRTLRRGACCCLRARYSRIASPMTACSCRPSRSATACIAFSTSGSAWDEYLRRGFMGHHQDLS